MNRLLVLIALAACQAPLATPMVSLEPADPDSADDLVATVAGADAWELRWLRNGSVVDGLTDGIVPASMTRRGDTWRVEATIDRKRASVVGEATVSIKNAAPEVELTLAPQDPQAGDALVVAVVAWDADDDPLTVVTSWTRDGEPVSFDGDTIPADTTRRGEVWAVEVVANDGYVRSPVARAEALVTNAAPQVAAAAISPDVPYTDDDLHLDFITEDADGDAVHVQLSWTIDGVVVDGAHERTLGSDHFAKGDRVAAAILPSDGSSDGVPTVVGPVTIANTPPGMPGVRIEPDVPVAGESLRCRVSAIPSDADGDDMVEWSAFWTVDGARFDGTVSASIPGDTVPAGITDGDQRWACGIQASDGDDWGAWNYASRTVEWDGFHASQEVAGRTVTCASVVNDGTWTECTGLRVEGQAFPNGVSCSLGWSTTPSPVTDHASFCEQVTGSPQFMADYTCGFVEERVTWNGSTWGSRDDNGFTDSVRCHW